jgi:hypothetical protein
MGKGAPPTPPDPTTTAGAQTASNIGTAISQQQINSTNQVTPYGSLTYSQTGTYKYTDPTTGKTYDLPQMTATQTLSPAEQQLLDTNTGTQQILANTAQTEAGKLGGLLDTPLDLSQANLDAYTNTHFLDQFNQQSDRDQASLTASLAQQGITPGSAAYDNAMTQFNNQKASNLNGMLSNSQANAMQAILAQRETPINEISALAGGSQVQTPTFANTPQTQVAGTDVAGITNSAYQNQLAGWQAHQAQTQDMLGGLFGLGSAGIFKWSDERLKENIEKVGELPDKTNVYEYDFKPDGSHQIGVMAQEVEKTNPGAVVTTDSGFKAVNYNKVIADAMLKRRAA